MNALRDNKICGHVLSKVKSVRTGILRHEVALGRLPLTNEPLQYQSYKLHL